MFDIQRIEESINKKTAKPLEQLSPSEYKALEPRAVIVGKDNQERTKVIIQKGQFADLIFDLSIPGEKKELSERWDMNRLAKIGFIGKSLRQIKLSPGAKAGGHYHKQEVEILFVPDSEEKVRIELKDIRTEQSIEIELGSETKKINGNNYYLSVIIWTNILHTVKNPEKNSNRVTLFAIANQSHDPADSFNNN